jgi:hypothetical protein
MPMRRLSQIGTGLKVFFLIINLAKRTNQTCSKFSSSQDQLKSIETRQSVVLRLPNEHHQVNNNFKTTFTAIKTSSQESNAKNLNRNDLNNLTISEKRIRINQHSATVRYYVNLTIKSPPPKKIVQQRTFNEWTIELNCVECGHSPRKTDHTTL